MLTFRPASRTCDVPGCRGALAGCSSRYDVRVCHTHIDDPKAVMAAGVALWGTADGEPPAPPYEPTDAEMAAERAILHHQAVNELGPDYVVLAVQRHVEVDAPPAPPKPVPYDAVIREAIREVGPEAASVAPAHVEALMRVEWGVLDARPFRDFVRYVRMVVAWTAEHGTAELDEVAESYGYEVAP